MADLLPLDQHLQTFTPSPSDVTRWTREIHAQLIAQSAFILSGNFDRIHADDLSRAFDLYDAQFFGGHLGPALRGPTRTLGFRFSKRMTQVGGTASVKRKRNGHETYEIALSSTLLFDTFSGDHRDITVNGLRCTDRLEALQRVFEHELIHLVEFRLHGASSCRKAPFKDLVHRLFGHTETTHRLITPRERASATYGVRVGQRVRFEHGGRAYEGVVRRITKRATVLVEDPGGEPYTDGKTYRKFYVPVRLLEPADS